VETTTTTAPRPVYSNPDFLAANFSDRILPAAAKRPVRTPPHTPVELVVTATFGVVAGATGTAVAARRLPRVPRR
jgi:hypothetical protein